MTISKIKASDDLGDIIRLIYETDEYIYPSMCGGDYSLFARVMRELLSKDGIFNFCNFIVVRKNNRVVGILHFFSQEDELPEATSIECADTVVMEYFGQLLSKLREERDGVVWRDDIYISSICVAKEHRRQGLATELMDFFEGYFADRTIVLDCLEKGVAAVNFYKNRGFLAIDSFLGFTGSRGGQVHCIRFEKGRRSLPLVRDFYNKSNLKRISA